ncbi:MAG: sulfotransferase domain-containing protein [Rhodothermia bacterium]|nr:MAG: sulfotransferase domain-containing protein [Rhodothermia bacterium]
MKTALTDQAHTEFAVGKYEDALHAEALEDLQIGEFGYKYRILDGVVMPPYITPERYKMSRTIANRPGDICFTGFPKSGSTWLSYVLLMITRDGELPTDKTLRNCLHWVASSFTYPRSREYLESLPSPRIFKSHMPYDMAVGGSLVDSPCRHIYIARNPKDVVVSYYYFEKSKSWAGGYNGPWDHWLKMFLEGKVQRGDWFDHVLSWWNRRDAENILFLKYEDLKKDFDTEVRKIARFLDYPMSSELLTSIKEKTSFHHMQEDHFSNMHEIEELGGFFRRGQVGSWQEQFTFTQNEFFDEIYETRLKGSGLNFYLGE